jgi:hypothetical protein
MNLAHRLAEAGARRAGIRAAADLAALVRESVTADAVREVLHLRLGALAPALRRPHHRRLMREALDGALGAARAQVFDLPNGDIVAIARPPAPALAAAEAALAASLDAAAAHVVRRLRLPEGAAALLNAAAQSLGLEAAALPASTPAPEGSGFDTAELAAAERALATADLAPLTQGAAVCRLDPEGAPPAVIWEDRRIAWPALAATLLPGCDLAAAPALARRLERAAELRLLAELARPTLDAAWRRVGLTLAPATLAAPGFARFAEALPTGRRRDITIGLRPAALLAAPSEPVLATLRRGGFRLALDDTPPALLGLLAPLLPGAPAGLDLLRLRWDPGLPAAMPEPLAALLGTAPESVVLTGVDRAAAIAWGWEAGIRLFQGPLVEKRRRGV